MRTKTLSLVLILIALSLVGLGTNSAIHKNHCRNVQLKLNIEDKTSKFLFLHVQNAALNATRIQDPNVFDLKNRAIAF